jgi:segregation and condensation protein B
MPQIPEPPNEPRQQEGISLDELARAFAQVMCEAPRQQPDVSQAVAAPAESDQPAQLVQQAADSEPETDRLPSITQAGEDACPISPLSILEAMLFVGNRDNRPLSAAKAAELMRDVQAEEIPALVDELNNRYDADACPYQIIGLGDGYRLALKKTYSALLNKFYGRIRETRLSQAAIDVLAIVAYQQPLTGERVSHLRGKPSSHILTQLVRRGLLRIERHEGKRRTHSYCTTERFLRLFNLKSLDDLPRGEDAQM